jgi:hypothetical protein
MVTLLILASLLAAMLLLVPCYHGVSDIVAIHVVAKSNCYCWSYMSDFPLLQASVLKLVSLLLLVMASLLTSMLILASKL